MQLPSDINSISSESSVTSFIDFISDLNFSDFLDKEKKSPSAKFIQVGEATYKIDSEFSESIHRSNFEDTSFSKKTTKEGSGDGLSDGIKDISTTEINVPNFLQLQLVPVKPHEFISQLPQHLSSFINELAQIIKTYRYDTQSIDYRFHFKQLNLDIVLSKQEDMLSVRLFIADTALQKDFDQDTQKHMLKFLQDKLDTNDIDLFFDFYSFDEFSQQQQSSQQNEESEDESDNNEEDSDEISTL